MPRNPLGTRPKNGWARGATLLCGFSLAALLGGAGGESRSTVAGRARADTTCAACRNFYEYANKSWLDTATIPPDLGDWGVWSANDSRVTAQLRATLESAAAGGGAHATPGDRALGTFNAGCMDSARAEAAGIGPLRPALARIDSVASPAELARELGRLHRDGVPALFAFSSEVDRAGGLRYMGLVQQRGLTLSTPEEYLGADPALVRRRQSYVAHVARTLALTGEAAPDARRDADRVLTMESALAGATMTRLQRDEQTPEQAFRRFSRAQLEAATAGFPWDAYLRERGAPALSAMLVPQPAYLAAAARLVAERPMAEWRAYLRWHLLSDASPFLSSAFVDESFRFARETTGATTPTPRAQRCARETSADLPELLGRAYAARVFPPASKARIDTMVRQIRAVLIERVKTVPWLTGPTRAKALAKARTFGVKIGYPDRWHDYSSLRIGAGSFLDQRANARRFESDRLVARIGQLPDRTEWDFHGIYYFLPQSPTAWANWDEIIFPAAYLQAPLFDANADLATNFGGIGIVIAHEMTHLFTADGAGIDATGRIRRWRTAADSARFAAVEQRIVRQYDGYTLLDSATHVNGAMTLSENLADIGGVELAYAALERALSPAARRAAGDTTPEMRFFLANAHARASKSRPAYARQQLATDGHAPTMFRVNGPLSDFAPFAAAFGCKPGDPMVRPDSARARIW